MGRRPTPCKPISVEGLPVSTPVNEHVFMERLTGVKEIEAYLGWNRGKWHKWKNDMRSDGIIFTEISGVPKKRHIFTFTSLLHRWLIIKTLQGTTF